MVSLKLEPAVFSGETLITLRVRVLVVDWPPLSVAFTTTVWLFFCS